MKQFTRNTIKTLCLGIILGTSVLSMAQTTGKENEKLIPFGDFNSWMVRIIDESFVIGGNTKTLYEVAPVDTIRGDKPYISSTVSPWRTSNVMAKVSGVTKCSISVFPEKRDDGYCVRVETLMEKCKVQAIVNTMGVSAMAAFTAASRIDDFAYTPQQNIAHAMTTFMAQNEGAGKKDRVKDGYRCGMRIEVVYALGLMAVCLIFAEPIIRLFVTDPEVVDLGVRFLRTISLFYLMPAATNGIQGFFRGIGDLRITLISSILNMAGRVAAASVLVLLWKMEIEALPYSYAFGWVLMLAYELPAMLRYLRKNKM